MKLNLKFRHKALALVAVPLAFELLFVGILIVLLNRAEYEVRRAEHSKAILTETNGVINDFMKAGMCLYMFNQTEASTFKQQFADIAQNAPKRFETLKVLLRDSSSSDRAESLARVEKISNDVTSAIHESSLLVDESSVIGKKKLDVTKDTDTIFTGIVSDLRDFLKNVEKTETYDPAAEARSRLFVQEWLSLGVAFNIILAGFLAIAFNRSTTSRLGVLMDNTSRLVKNEQLQAEIGGTDEIAHLDHTFHNMADALAEAAARKQELVAMVSHDLRTPLSSVQGCLTLMTEGVYGELPPKAKNELIAAESNTTRLIHLINDLLDIEKMEAGKLTMSFGDCDLEPVLKSSRDAVTGYAQQYKVKLEVLPTSARAYADPERLVQVVVNLLSNAIKYSPKDGTVTLSVEENADWATVKIADQGRGIPEKFRKSIFERFQQVEHSDQRKGTGLGLAICKAIVDEHKGEIGVDSKEGEGSVFWFRVPKKAPASLPGLAAPQAKSAAG
jgi:signal transduction histidine kinase